MKTVGLLISAAVIFAIPGAAMAHPAPKPSKNYSGNYKTLADDQKASPQIARCIATGYDYAESGKTYDRLGFTQEDIAAATADSTAVSVSGQARQNGTGNWVDITLRCAEAGGSVSDIEIAPGK